MQRMLQYSEPSWSAAAAGHHYTVKQQFLGKSFRKDQIS
jgi:hypothetical protein